MNIIDIKKLTQQYHRGKIIINNISFGITKGSIHGLIGRNGAGKTTIVKSIIGALPSSKGAIKISKNGTKKISIAYMPEKSLFPIGLTSFAYVSYLGFLSGIPLKKSKQKTIELFKQYQIKHLLYKKPSKLSSGERKKIMLMQVLINDADFLILDEPSSNLDPMIQATLFNVIRELNKAGKTILISSHNLLAIDEFITEITVLEKGTILYTGPVEKFKEKNSLNNAYVKLMTNLEKQTENKDV